MTSTTHSPTKPERDSDPGPDLPEVKMHLHTPKDPGVGVIVKSEPCTSRKAAGFVRHIEVDVSGSNLAGAFRAGQSFGVLAPGLNAKGKPHPVRLYSIAAPTAGEDGSGNILSTTLKRVLDEHWDDHRLFTGVCSNYLADLQVGDKVQVTGPNGKRFILPARPEEHDFVFFATGTGIAPFRAMLLDLLAAKSRSKIVLVMGSPYASDLLYHEYLTDLAQQLDNFTYLTAISRESHEDGAGKLYVQDRIATHSDLLVPLLESDRSLLYICGIAGMELGIFKELAGQLAPDKLPRLLRVDPEIAKERESWTRKMINRQLRPTRRVFLEVY